jgi:hypothetical protein
MDPNFKPFRIGGIEALERYPCGKAVGEKGRAKVYYLCRCLSCGKQFVLTGDELNKKPKSCGCLAHASLPSEAVSAFPVVERLVEHRHSQPRENPNKNSLSSQVGVYFDKEKRFWRAQIACRGEQISLGSYSSEAEAAAARKGAMLLFDAMLGEKLKNTDN